MIIGTAGHIDHGKTSLVRKLTGVDTDRLPEEKSRGISIDLGFAYHRADTGRVLGFVDVPGHERFIRNMLAGATGIDFVLLAIAANDGPKPQTIEHLQIIDLLGIKHGVVALTKIDKVSAMQLETVKRDVLTLLRGTCLDGAPVVPISSLTGLGIKELLLRLEAEAERVAVHQAQGHFRLAIDRCFTMAGVGTVVTGTVHSGHVMVGERLVVSPSGTEVRVRGIHADGLKAGSGSAGQRCALNLTGPELDKDRVHRGEWILDRRVHAPTEAFDGTLRLLPSDREPLRSGTSIHLHLGTEDVLARLYPLGASDLRPGEGVLARIVLQHPIGTLHGDRFIVRDPSAQRTFGGGVVLDAAPPRKGKSARPRLDQLNAMSTTQTGSALDRLLELMSGGMDLGWFALNWNLKEQEAAELWDSRELVRVPLSGCLWGIAPRRMQDIQENIIALVTEFHRANATAVGMSHDELISGVGRNIPAFVAKAALKTLVAKGQLRVQDFAYRIADHEPASSGPDQLWGKVLACVEAAKYSPLTVSQIAATLQEQSAAIKTVLRRHAGTGLLVQISADTYSLRSVLPDLAHAACALQGVKGVVDTAEFRDRVGISRKGAIQVLEYFDQLGLTAWSGKARIVRATGDRILKLLEAARGGVPAQ